MGMEDLPGDMLYEISRHLEEPKDVWALAATSQKIHDQVWNDPLVWKDMGTRMGLAPGWRNQTGVVKAASAPPGSVALFASTTFGYAPSIKYRVGVFAMPPRDAAYDELYASIPSYFRYNSILDEVRAIVPELYQDHDDPATDWVFPPAFLMVESKNSPTLALSSLRILAYPLLHLSMYVASEWTSSSPSERYDDDMVGLCLDAFVATCRDNEFHPRLVEHAARGCTSHHAASGPPSLKVLVRMFLATTLCMGLCEWSEEDRPSLPALAVLLTPPSLVLSQAMEDLLIDFDRVALDDLDFLCRWKDTLISLCAAPAASEE